MTYLGLLIIPVAILVLSVLSPMTRQKVSDQIVQAAHTGLERTVNAWDKLKEKDLGQNLSDLQRRIAAFLLRQAAQSIDRK